MLPNPGRPSVVVEINHAVIFLRPFGNPPLLVDVFEFHMLCISIPPFVTLLWNEHKDTVIDLQTSFELVMIEALRTLVEIVVPSSRRDRRVDGTTDTHEAADQAIVVFRFLYIEIPPVGFSVMFI